MLPDFKVKQRFSNWGRLGNFTERLTEVNLNAKQSDKRESLWKEKGAPHAATKADRPLAGQGGDASPCHLPMSILLTASVPAFQIGVLKFTLIGQFRSHDKAMPGQEIDSCWLV